jgi:hypothetical protein
MKRIICTVLAIVMMLQTIIILTSNNKEYLNHYTRQGMITPLQSNKRHHINGPKIIWLMSFPNSGTSFTSQLVRAYSNAATASNYGEHHLNKNGLQTPLADDPEYSHGPSLTVTDRELEIGEYILTKTHCAGTCSRCGPRGYVVDNLTSFKDACLTARQVLPRNHTDNGSIIINDYEETKYSEHLVARAVHLIRHPIDNIVSRFHLTQSIQKKNGNGTFVNTYPNNKEGFRQWCKVRNGLYTKQQKDLYGEKLHDLLSNVPCHADFYRYTQWHNYAFDVVEQMGIPSLIIHYEDYSKEFNRTKDQLLDFIEVKENKEKDISFVAGKEYSSYLTSEEREAVMLAIKELSNDRVLHELRRYFND